MKAKILIISRPHEIETLNKEVIQELISTGKAILVSMEELQYALHDFGKSAEVIDKVVIDFNRCVKEFKNSTPDNKGSQFMNKPKHNFKRH